MMICRSVRCVRFFLNTCRLNHSTVFLFDSNHLKSSRFTTMNSDLNEETLLSVASLYAVDLEGVCHVFDNEINEQSLSTRPNDNDETISQSIIAPPNSIESSPRQTFLSTQPFSILNLNETDFSSFEPIINCSPVQFSGQIAAEYRNETSFCSEEIHENIETKKKKLKRLNPTIRRFILLKKQLKLVLKKKKLRKKSFESEPIEETTTIIVEDQTKPIESESPEDYSAMLNPSLPPDLSKRKYIYKDISMTTNNVNPINWKIFQCTQTQSTISYPDSSMTNEQIVRPFYLANHSVSLPDIRIGLSRHQSTKQLHKTLLD